MLPNINLNPISKDANPLSQISALRSQLAMLKDGVEESLSSISYDNLNSALRKKIDAIDEIKVYAQEQANIVAETLAVDVIQFNESIQSVNGSISTINGNISTLNGTVSGLRGEFDSLASHVVTSEYLLANYITASQISANYATISSVESTYLKTSNLSAQLSALSNVAISSMSLTNSIIVNYGTKSYALSPVILNGYVVLGAKYS